MRGSRNRYKYADTRDRFMFEDGRARGFFKLYAVEVQHLAAARLGASAILLYLFIGTRCSGNREGFSIGGKQIQRDLNMSRSTVYQALRSLKDAGLVTHRDEEGRTIYALANVDGSGTPMGKAPETVQDSRQQSSEIPDNKEDNSDCPGSPENRDPSPQAPQPDQVSTDQVQVSTWRDHANSEKSLKDAWHSARRLSVPLDLVAEVWGELSKCAKETTEGDAVFDRALEGDNSLVLGFVAHFKNDARWDFKNRHRWFQAALEEAGRWGPECDVDQVNARSLAAIRKDEADYLARSSGEEN